MANIPVKETTHNAVKNMRRELEYKVKADISQEDIINLMIKNISLDDMIIFYNKLNNKEFVSKIEEETEI